MTLKRDKEYISKNLINKNNKIYCSQKTIIEFPKWYEDKDLLDQSDKVYLYGIFAIVIDDKYSVSVIPTLITTEPLMVNEIERDGVIYLQFTYAKGDCIIANTSIVKNESLSYNLFENFYLSARIPWFVEYEDLVRILDNVFPYSKSNLGNNYIANELTTSFISRASSDKRLFYRQKTTDGISFTDMNNVYYSALSTLNKIGGNYFISGLTSALVQKEKAPTKLENLVRL